MPRWLAFFLLISGVYASWGCGGSKQEGQGEEVAAREIKPLRSQRCEDGDSEELLDASGDGYANVRHVVENGRRRCTEIDLNLDKRVDVTRKLDESGNIVFEQHDFDFDGRLDQQVFFEGGRIARREIDTNFDRMVDTWVWCEGSLVAKLERDRRHTGRVDTWEEYQSGLLASARYDDNNDGKPERWETYRAGRLSEIAYDTNNDGKPERRDEIDAADADSPLEPVSCDGGKLPEQASARAAAASSGGESSDEAGESESESEAGEDGADDAAGDESAEEEQ
ncbi:MAG: hypothetical protein OEZ06_03330 [Myxococcales bacterium]|nr:hypothetical protein [Myxococcales bacterium]